MTTRIKATCAYGCGDISVLSQDVVVRQIKGQEDSGGQYRMICPTCNKIVLKDCPKDIVALLLESGVKHELFELPLELLERPSAVDAAPIDIDDVLNLGLELQQDEAGWFQRMRFGKKGQ